MERVVDEVMAPLAAIGDAWPADAAQMPLEKRARAFVRQAWERVYAPPSYVAAWSMFFGCKTTPLFQRIDEHRETHDPLYFAQFIAIFPEIASTQAQPEDFAAVIFAALRGLALMRLLKADDKAADRQLEMIADMIVRAGAA